MTEELSRRCEALVSRTPREVVLTRLEQLDAVNAAITHLKRALDSTEFDLFAADVRHTLVSLAPLIGQTPTEEILGRIFSEFCIGK